MATEIPEQAVVGANPPLPPSSPSPAVRDHTVMGSSDKAEVSADTSATVTEVKGKGDDSPPPCDFKIGEIVLAWYGDLLYEAKILKADYGPCWRVHVHYKGWKNTYNEWLLLDKLLKDTEENRKLKAELERSQKMKKEKSANSGSKPKIGTGTRGRKRKADIAQMDQPTPSGKITLSSSSAKTSSPAKMIPASSQSSPAKIPTSSQSSPAKIISTSSQENIILIPIPSQENTILSQENTIPIPSQENIIAPSSHFLNITWPPSLKKILIEDWECINQSDKLIKLPRSPTVDEILSKYEELRVKKEPRYTDTIVTMVDGVRDYFNKLLPLLLLYKSERPQMEEVTANGVAPSSVYGAEHLLRFFVKFPDVLDCSDIEEDLLAEFQQNLMDMLKFLQKNQTNFCLPPHQYIEAPATSEKQE